jgi:hypothetical protein
MKNKIAADGIGAKEASTLGAISTMENAPKFTLESWLKLAEQIAADQPEPMPTRLVDFLDQSLAI